MYSSKNVEILVVLKIMQFIFVQVKAELSILFGPDIPNKGKQTHCHSYDESLAFCVVWVNVPKIK